MTTGKWRNYLPWEYKRNPEPTNTALLQQLEIKDPPVTEMTTGKWRNYLPWEYKRNPEPTNTACDHSNLPGIVYFPLGKIRLIVAT